MKGDRTVDLAASEPGPPTTRPPAAGARVRGDHFYGRRYGEATDELVAQAASWLCDGPPSDAVAIKPGLIHRWGDLAIKRFPPHRGLGGAERWLRRLPAVRAAAEYARVWPVPAAAPLVALGLRGRAGDSLLVSEFIDGKTLRDAWHVDPAVRAALPAFVASLYEHGVKFGDLHAQNLVWNGRALHLVDLDAMRNPAHRLGRLSVLWWVTLLRSLNDDDGVRAAHDACFELLGHSAAPRSGSDANWQEVREMYEIRYGGRKA